MSPGGNGSRYGRVRALISVLVLVLMVAASITGSNRTSPDKKPAERRPPYGEYLDWREVREIFPRHGNAVVVDLDTGMRFNVQRRGGAYHADVQPLAAVDTEIMKKIYGGEWSWKRRAVLVLAGGGQIAGSMTGMPHGGGSIRGNNFPGHFCIHFRGSRLHLNGREDLAHRIMVCKAAGVLTEMMEKVTAEEAVKIFFTALDQKELNVSVRSSFFNSPADLLDFYRKAAGISRVKINRASEGEKGVVDVSLSLVFNNDKRNYNKKQHVRAVYHSYAGWRVDYLSAAPLLERSGGTASPSALMADEVEDAD